MHVPLALASNRLRTICGIRSGSYARPILCTLLRATRLPQISSACYAESFRILYC